MNKQTKISIALFASVILSIPVSVNAIESTAMSFAADDRIKRFIYDEYQVYRLTMDVNYVTTIEFERDEMVEAVQMGDSSSWQANRLNRGDILAIKPLVKNAATNMTIYTSKRVYTFELNSRIATTGGASRSYRVMFSTPTPVMQDFTEATKAVKDKPNKIRYEYIVAGDNGRMLVSVYDDGEKTYFRLMPNFARPAVFTADENGYESSVNVEHDGELIIAHKTSKRWVLRIGNEHLCIERK